MTDCLFCKIVSKEIPAEILFQDDRLIAFRDVTPQAPTHVLVIPKVHISTLFDLPDQSADLLGHMQTTATEIARLEGLDNGFRLVMNCLAEGGQSVFHIHLHLLGGRQMEWPPG
jgi:histidine triad (HIT) family protein